MLALPMTTKVVNGLASLSNRDVNFSEAPIDVNYIIKKPTVARIQQQEASVGMGILTQCSVITYIYNNKN